MKRRTFFGWLASLVGVSQLTSVKSTAALPPPEPEPVYRPRPAYHRDGMPRWQHHAPVDMAQGPWFRGRQHRVAFLRNPAKAERVRITSKEPREYLAAIEATTGQSFQFKAKR